MCCGERSGSIAGCGEAAAARVADHQRRRAQAAGALWSGGQGGLSLQQPGAARPHSSSDFVAVRVLTDHPRTLPAAPPVIPLPDYLKEIVGREGMHELPHGIKGHYAPNAFKLMDGRVWYDADVFSARTTLLKKTNGSWIQIENSSDYAYEASPFGPIANRGCKRITLFRMESFGEGFFEGRGMAPKASTRFAAENHTMETDEGDYLEELAAGKAVEKAKKVFERAPRPVTEPPAVPSEAEVKAHRLTHIPYARWCSTCVKTRARGDKHGSRKEVDRTPVVQVDFFFTTVDPDGRPGPRRRSCPSTRAAWWASTWTRAWSSPSPAPTK